MCACPCLSLSVCVCVCVFNAQVQKNVSEKDRNAKFPLNALIGSSSTKASTSLALPPAAGQHWAPAPLIPVPLPGRCSLGARGLVGWSHWVTSWELQLALRREKNRGEQKRRLSIKRKRKHPQAYFWTQTIILDSPLQLCPPDEMMAEYSGRIHDED